MRDNRLSSSAFPVQNMDSSLTYLSVIRLQSDQRSKVDFERFLAGKTIKKPSRRNEKLLPHKWELVFMTIQNSRKFGT